MKVHKMVGGVEAWRLGLIAHPLCSASLSWGMPMTLKWSKVTCLRCLARRKKGGKG